MSRMMKYSFLLLLLLMTVGCNAMQTKGGSTLDRIQERGQLILGTSGNMPTMTQVDAQGKVSGFDIDIARLMADVMEVKLVTEVMPFNELLPALESGKVDVVISNVTITPKRNLRVAFVGPYMRSGKCFVTKNASLAKAENSQDLNTPETRLA
ncbi:MAG: transporter substrate-binding domain-containing protein, partial [Sedimenticolaceae bacterium]